MTLRNTPDAPNDDEIVLPPNQLPPYLGLGHPPDKDFRLPHLELRPRVRPMRITIHDEQVRRQRLTGPPLRGFV